MSRQFRYVAPEGAYVVAGFGLPHWVEPDDVFEVPDEDGESYAIEGLQNIYVEVSGTQTPTVSQSYEPMTDETPSTTEALQ